MSRRKKNNIKDTSNSANSTCSNMSKDSKFDTETTSKSKGSRNGSRDRRSRQPGGKTNHPAWYAQDPALLQNVASIPFSWAMGTTIGFDFPNMGGITENYTVPGICNIRITPSVGTSTNGSSPLSIASNAVYSFVRHANSGHANYDAPDLMIYLLAMSQVYSYIMFLQRAYGVATLYSSGNRYTPQVLLEEMSINPDDMRKHLSDFRYGINLLINNTASFNVPANMPIFDKLSFVYANIYTEGPSVKDQWYMYTPDRFWKYKLNTDGAGMLESCAFASGGPYTVDALLQYGFDMIDRLTRSEDMGIMNGDILKAYGTNTLKLASLPDYYPLVPLFDPLVLEQMKNSTIIPSEVLSNLNILQDATHSYLHFDPKFKSDRPDTTLGKAYRMSDDNYVSSRLLSTSSPVTDPSLVMEITRNVAYVREFSVADVRTASIVAEAFICSGCRLRSMESFQEIRFQSPYTDDLMYTAGAVIKTASYASVFKYHPQMWIDAYDATDNLIQNMHLVWDIDNYALVSPQQIENLHTAALCSLFNVPYALTGKMQ